MKFYGSLTSPQRGTFKKVFRITVAKVSVLGPDLYWATVKKICKNPNITQMVALGMTTKGLDAEGIKLTMTTSVIKSDTLTKRL